MATALITGASSGIGCSMAIMLAKRGYDLVLVARNTQALQRIAERTKAKVTIISADLSRHESCFEVYQKTKDMDIEVLINNAGFGIFGDFTSTSLEKQLEMLNLNVDAVHILTHLFLRDFIRKDKGYILNVASLAAYTSGPLLAAYYASKSYVYRLSTAINYELKNLNSSVCVSVLCPGPTATDFNNRAGVEFSIKPMSSKKVAKCGLDGMFAGKSVIVPGLMNKLCSVGMQHAPLDFVMGICYKIQYKKQKKK